MEIPEWILGCVEVERKAAELYDLFAKRFPEEAEMFNSLSEEELGHINLLNSVDTADSSSDMDIRLQSMLLLRTLDAMDRLLNQTRTSALELEDALKAAVSLEEGLAESFATSLKSINMLNGSVEIDSLSEDSSRHADTLRQALIRNGFMHYS